MKLDLQRTIVAVASGVAPARRAIVRISGHETRSIVSRLIDQEIQANAATTLQGSAGLGSKSSIWGSSRVEVNILYWPDHRSYTGEPCAELHLLGSLPIVESLVERLVALGATPAQPGEFTLRSFLAGKLDLPQAEAVLGVIEAETDDDLTAALQQLGGNVSKPVRRLRDQLIELTAHLEAGLDFVEEDIEFITSDSLAEGLQRIADELAAIIEQLRSRGARSRNASVVLVGLPNSGKSSLLNALVGSQRAIVSPQAGTTRDAVTVRVDVNGLTVELTDTAGIEELQEQSPRAMAQEILRDRLLRADVALLCLDLQQPPTDAWLSAQQASLQSMLPTLLWVGTKTDLAHDSELATRCALTVSAHDSNSIQRLKAKLAQTLHETRGQLHSDAMHATATRCRGELELAQAAIARALHLVAHAMGEELVATELRIAIDDLSSVIGEVHSEDILGEIFGRFCIGK